MKCWAWEYFRTSVARSAILVLRPPDLAGTPAKTAGALDKKAALAVERPMATANSRLVHLLPGADCLIFTCVSMPRQGHPEDGSAGSPRTATRPHTPR